MRSCSPGQETSRGLFYPNELVMCNIQPSPRKGERKVDNSEHSFQDQVGKLGVIAGKINAVPVLS